MAALVVLALVGVVVAGVALASTADRETASSRESTVTGPRAAGPTTTDPPVTVLPDLPPLPDDELTEWPTTPRFVGDLVVLPVGDHVVAHDAVTGEERWRSESCTMADWASPVVNQGTDAIVVECGTANVRLDAATGARMWEIADTEEVEWTRVAGSTLLLADALTVRVIDIDSGEELWRRRGMGPATPTADAEQVYISTDAGVSAYDRATGDTRWALPGASSDLWVGPSSLISRTGDQRVESLDPATGAVRWSGPSDVARLHWSVVVGEVDGGIVLLTREYDDLLTVVDAATGVIRWGYDAPPGGSLLASAAGSRVVVSVTDPEALTPRVVVLDGATGAVVDEHSSAIAAAVSGSRLAVVTVGTRGWELRLEDLGG